MIRVEVDLKIWLKKTKLKVAIYTCPNCGKEFPTDVPVMCRDYIGLESKIHECGPNYTSLVLSPQSKEEVEIWRSIFN